MNNAKALRAAQKTLDKEYAKLDRAYLRTINFIGKILDEEIKRAKVAKEKGKR